MQNKAIEKLLRARKEDWFNDTSGEDLVELVGPDVRGQILLSALGPGRMTSYPLLLSQAIDPAFWDFWYYFLTSPAKLHKPGFERPFRNGSIARLLSTKCDSSQKANNYRALHPLKLCPWDLPSDLATIHESNKFDLNNAWFSSKLTAKCGPARINHAIYPIFGSRFPSSHACEVSHFDLRLQFRCKDGQHCRRESSQVSIFVDASRPMNWPR